MTEDDTFKVLRRKVSYGKMRIIVEMIRMRCRLLENYEATDREIRMTLEEYGWDYVDFFMGGKFD